MITRSLFRGIGFCLTALLLTLPMAGAAEPGDDAKAWEVYFANNSSAVDKATSASLKDVVDALKQDMNAGVMIIGHTDDVAGAAYNKKLALRRADAIGDKLVRMGVSKKRITAVGAGLLKPKYDNGTEEGRAKNRRAEIHIVKGGSGELVRLTSYVSVVDDNGKVIPNLPKDNFQIFQGDAARKITDITYVGDNDPVSVVLAIDKSNSMYNALPLVKNAAKAFIENKMSRDQLQVIAFSREIYMGNQFSSDKAQLMAAIDGIKTEGHTRLYDAIYAGSVALQDKLPPRILILLTDGKDEHGFGKPASKYSLHQAIAAAQLSHTTVLAIGLGDDVDTQILATIAVATGGNFFPVTSADQLEPLYTHIAKSLLRGKYQIDYLAPRNALPVVAVRSKKGRVIGYK